jgi:hypothetical protein
MNIFIPIFILFILLAFYAYLNRTTIEGHLPFYSSPPKRNMSYDIRCEDPNPRIEVPFRNSSIQYYYRPKCLRGI